MSGSKVRNVRPAGLMKRPPPPAPPAKNIKPDWAMKPPPPPAPAEKIKAVIKVYVTDPR